MSNSVAVNEGVKVERSKFIRAKRQRVYDAWTNPEMLQQWFGPARLAVADVRADLKVGGAYRIEMRERENNPESGKPDGSRVASGVYQEIVPGERLSFTWRGTWDQLNEETLVTVLFKDVDGGTEVTLIHERFASSESVGGYSQGWQDTLDKLARFCAA